MRNFHQYVAKCAATKLITIESEIKHATETGLTVHSKAKCTKTVTLVTVFATLTLAKLHALESVSIARTATVGEGNTAASLSIIVPVGEQCSARANFRWQFTDFR